MKAAATVGVLALLLALPAQAQRGVTVHISGGGGAPHGFGGHPVRVVSPPPAGVGARPAGPSHWMGVRPVRPGVVILRPNFVPTRPAVRTAPTGFGNVVRRFPPPRPPFSFLGRRFVRFGFRRGFGFPFCSPVFAIRFATRGFSFFDRELVCFPRPFVSPFFFPIAPIIGSSTLLLPSSAVFLEAPPAAPQQGEEVSGEPYAPANPPGATQQSPTKSEQKAPPPLTLLQLKDGSMYALTDYWVENGQFYYITSYGGENAVLLDRIDFDKTVQLNWERGVEFVLRPKPSAR